MWNRAGMPNLQQQWLKTALATVSASLLSTLVMTAYLVKASVMHNVGRFFVRPEHRSKKVSMDHSVWLIRDWKWSQWNRFVSGGFALLASPASLWALENM
jgi:hypothetical protein